MNMCTTRTAAIACVGLLAGGCAKISAPSIDYAGPTPSVDIKATAQDALFSHFTGALTVTSISLQHAGPAAPAASSLVAGTSGGTTTVRLSAAPTFSVGDIVTVNWSGNAVTLVGAHYVIAQTTQYRILTASLKVQTPWGGLGPNGSGKVCVALLPNAPSDVTVTLDSSVVSVAPTTLRIAAGQPSASTAANATIGGFTCPMPTTGAASTVPQPPRCDGTNGVTATATLGGVSIHGCGNTGQSCCGIDGHVCGSTVAPPASICPP
jgi:hypothetical protein